MAGMAAPASDASNGVRSPGTPAWGGGSPVTLNSAAAPVLPATKQATVSRCPSSPRTQGREAALPGPGPVLVPASGPVGGRTPPGYSLGPGHSLALLPEPHLLHLLEEQTEQREFSAASRLRRRPGEGGHSSQAGAPVDPAHTDLKMHTRTRTPTRAGAQPAEERRPCSHQEGPEVMGGRGQARGGRGRSTGRRGAEAGGEGASRTARAGVQGPGLPRERGAGSCFSPPAAPQGRGLRLCPRPRSS